jgi:hypothetical protein
VLIFDFLVLYNLFHNIQKIFAYHAGVIPYDIIQIRLDDVLFIHIVFYTYLLYVIEHGLFVGVGLQQFVNFIPYPAMYDIFTQVLHVLVQLQEINHATNVRMINGLYRINVFVADFNVLVFGDGLDEMIDVLFRELIETHTDKFILERLVDFTDIIANKTETHIVGRRLQ